MSGHSHWSTIKRQKGAADAKRGQLFSKLSRAIIVAARMGGGDPESNLRLRYAIDKARQASMPKDNIERAIKKGTGEGGDANFEEITYEGYGPGGVALLVEVATDNRNRTASELRKIFERAGGKMASVGSVAWMFDRKGLIAVAADTVEEDRLIEIALEAGADDVKRSGNTFEITCEPNCLSQLQTALTENGIAVQTAELSQISKTPIDADPETAKKVLKLMETLDEHDDVQNVYTNMNMTEELIAAAQVD